MLPVLPWMRPQSVLGLKLSREPRALPAAWLRSGRGVLIPHPCDSPNRRIATEIQRAGN
jgi:hypothetical protein